MDIFETINNVLDSNLIRSNLKFCLVDSRKRPFKCDATPARPNIEQDFVDFEMLLQCTSLDSYAGIGISVQASQVCAIDVDHCFSIPFDISSADERAKDVIERFKKFAYCEFSFSGTGLRVLFRTTLIDNYSDKYYIKNESKAIEYYQYGKSYRYVTITGMKIVDNAITFNQSINQSLIKFLDDYMTKPVKTSQKIKEVIETRSFDELMNVVKFHYFKNMTFQNLWFNPAPGSGKDESERDYHLVAYLFENVTQDSDLLKQLFEQSPFFKSKDFKHMQKWTNQNGRYFNYLYNNIRRLKL